MIEVYIDGLLAAFSLDVVNTFVHCRVTLCTRRYGAYTILSASVQWKPTAQYKAEDNKLGVLC